MCEKQNLNDFHFETDIDVLKIIVLVLIPCFLSLTYSFLVVVFGVLVRMISC